MYVRARAVKDMEAFLRALFRVTVAAKSTRKMVSRAVRQQETGLKLGASEVTNTPGPASVRFFVHSNYCTFRQLRR